MTYPLDANWKKRKGSNPTTANRSPGRLAIRHSDISSLFAHAESERLRKGKENGKGRKGTDETVSDDMRPQLPLI